MARSSYSTCIPTTTGGPGPRNCRPPFETNPEVNVGTGTGVGAEFETLVDRFIAELQQAWVVGHRLDVRENVRFRGGHFSRWVHEHYAGRGCALAIEFKKTFMDEWTGEPDPAELAAMREFVTFSARVATELLQR